MPKVKTNALLAEFIGSTLLCGVVVGSGIMALNLSGGNIAVALIGNSIATASILWVLVAILGPISGAHFNPAVTVAFYIDKKIKVQSALFYIFLQIFGCILGTLLAHAMFGQAFLQIASTERAGYHLLLSEWIATFALVFAIFGSVRYAPKSVPAAVALTVLAGYWWTSSTSFANPAITIGRALTNTFTGINPGNLIGFILAQFFGAVSAVILSNRIFIKTQK
ncbi:MAG: aquaporin [Hellea sp.]|nr:aquaporin [Hellea sp.]